MSTEAAAGRLRNFGHAMFKLQHLHRDARREAEIRKSIPKFRDSWQIQHWHGALRRHHRKVFSRKIRHREEWGKQRKDPASKIFVMRKNNAVMVLASHAKMRSKAR
ncbi:hypothetical protein A7X83_02830 [Stenotrophomonas maltophilia]|uniref:Uncharacterized protein n=1 Tax=Stenotrophomonas maltophilia TaxID=40324 RepID=A0A2W6JR08_STEMA|nr:hypothetical protein A7X83_02830 [Stenotrophomonas maltophilia]